MANGLGTFSKMFRKNAVARGLVQSKVHPRGKMSMDKVHALANNLEKGEFMPAMYKYVDPYKKGMQYMLKYRTMRPEGDGGQFADSATAKPMGYRSPKPSQLQMRSRAQSDMLKEKSASI